VSSTIGLPTSRANAGDARHQRGSRCRARDRRVDKGPQEDHRPFQPVTTRWLAVDERSFGIGCFRDEGGEAPHPAPKPSRLRRPPLARTA